MHVSSSDSHFNEVLEIAQNCTATGEDPDVDRLRRLFNPAEIIERSFNRLSERVSVRGDDVFFDGDPVDNSLTKQILKFLDSEEEDWEPLVNFFEKVQSNLNDHSREQLYSWVQKQEIVITEDGNMLAYKGVCSDGNGGFQSSSQGYAVVDGEPHNGHIPNYVGAVVEMPRGQVVHNPNNSCSTGLHIGSSRYAKTFATAAMLLVEVNPRDVVSVPRDGAGEKARVCRYRVLEIIEDEVQGVVYRESQDEPNEGDPDQAYAQAANDAADQGDHDEAEVCDECGEEVDYCREDHPEEHEVDLDDDLFVTVRELHPTQDEFDEMRKRAKRRRRNFVKYATKHGPWKLLAGDGSHPNHWEKP